jgi:uncharacterized membrane protein
MAVSPRRNRMQWALVASLGLNLVAVGIIGGAILKGPPPPDPGPGPSLWHFARSLPEPYRHDLSVALRESRPDWIGKRNAMENLSRSMAEALRAEPFDPAAAEAILRQQTEIANELSARGTDLLLAQMSRMSPEARDAYARSLLERRRKGSPGSPKH